MDDLTDLLQKGETEVLKGFTAKNKKKFSAALLLKTGEDGRKTVEFDFSKNEAEILEDVVCPDVRQDRSRKHHLVMAV